MTTIDADATGQVRIMTPTVTVTISPTGTVTVNAPLVKSRFRCKPEGAGLGDVIESRLSALKSALVTFDKRLRGNQVSSGHFNWITSSPPVLLHPLLFQCQPRR